MEIKLGLKPSRSKRRRWTWGRFMKGKDIFCKDYMTGSVIFSGLRMITYIAFSMSSITQKSTLKGPWLEFMSIEWTK